MSPAKYNPFVRSALSLNTKFVNNFFTAKNKTIAPAEKKNGDGQR